MDVDFWILVIGTFVAVAVFVFFLRMAADEGVVVRWRFEILSLVCLFAVCVFLNSLPGLILNGMWVLGWLDICSLFCKSLVLSVCLRIGLLWFAKKKGE